MKAGQGGRKDLRVSVIQASRGNRLGIVYELNVTSMKAWQTCGVMSEVGLTA